MTKRTIKLKKYVDIVEELIAAAAITPGHLVMLASTGKVQKHNSAGGPAIPMFALEDELQGKGIDEAYTTNDPVQVWVAQRGEVVYALLKDGENVAIGDFLVSDGAGCLKKYTAVEESMNPSHDSVVFTINDQIIVAQALEAIDLSGSSGTYPDSEFRIAVRVV